MACPKPLSHVFFKRPSDLAVCWLLLAGTDVPHTHTTWDYQLWGYHLMTCVIEWISEGKSHHWHRSPNLIGCSASNDKLLLFLDIPMWRDIDSLVVTSNQDISRAHSQYYKGPRKSNLVLPLFFIQTIIIPIPPHLRFFGPVYVYLCVI